jgi:outer membrane protein TolC
MNIRIAVLWVLSAIVASPIAAQDVKPDAPRHISLDEAVQFALKHNHYVRIAAYRVEQSEHSKEAARSSFFFTLRNESNLAHLTDTQFIAIPEGSLGTAGGTPIPERTAVLNQGGLTFVTSGTQLTQPVIELWKVRSANDVAAAETKAARSRAPQTENEIALRVHQIYYKLLIVLAHREAAEAKIGATEDLRNERLEQVKYGATLEQESIEARAQALDAQQDLLTTELQLSDATMQLDDVVGLPLTTTLALDPLAGQARENCERRKYLRAALAHELDARTSLLQAQLDYLDAQDEMREAIGRTPD